MADKERIDKLLVDRGMFPTREKAKSAILAGLIFINNQRIDKAGDLVGLQDEIQVRGETLKYVSRGGLKLEKAITQFGLDLTNLITMDIGASTGGFTDCMLQNGAAKVYSIDVGYGQLDWSLRQDERVVVMERTNFRYLTKEQIPDVIDMASIDVSFISLTKILPNLKQFLGSGSRIVALIKPQFEAGRDKVGKKGVVRDKRVHVEVIENILAFCKGISLYPGQLSFSPIKGPEGNIEYLLLLSMNNDLPSGEVSEEDIIMVVEQSHNL